MEKLSVLTSSADSLTKHAMTKEMFWELNFSNKHFLLIFPLCVCIKCNPLLNVSIDFKGNNKSNGWQHTEKKSSCCYKKTYIQVGVEWIWWLKNMPYVLQAEAWIKHVSSCTLRTHRGIGDGLYIPRRWVYIMRRNRKMKTFYSTAHKSMVGFYNSLMALKRATGAHTPISSRFR